MYTILLEMIKFSYSVVNKSKVVFLATAKNNKLLSLQIKDDTIASLAD